MFDKMSSGARQVLPGMALPHPYKGVDFWRLLLYNGTRSQRHVFVRRAGLKPSRHMWLG